MPRLVVLLFCFVFCTAFCKGDDVQEAIDSAELLSDTVDKETDLKKKAEKLSEGVATLSKALVKIKDSKKIYTDDELAPLYLYRGTFYFSLRDYELALDDFKITSKLNPKKINPWIHISLIQSASPIAKLRSGKEGLEASSKAFKALQVFAANEPQTALEKFQHGNDIIEMNDKIAIAAAAANAELGNFKEAITLIKDGRKELFKEYIDLYRDSKPYRLPVK